LKAARRGDTKLARGLDPVTRGPRHWLTPPAMARRRCALSARETSAIAEAVDELTEHRAYRISRTGEPPPPA